MTAVSPFTTFSWREMVEEADDRNRNYESLYPIVYRFSNERQFRDTGPHSGVYV